jgi:hypothetical protein
MTAFISPQELTYEDHKDEIQFLNEILANIQAKGIFEPKLQPTVDSILARLDSLMIASEAKLKAYGT